ncbi:expressed unknown protein [Ectocarpus siliculosus]|uniref:Uncharacterized protein n=1 Tax=Ectocarpus siliculosus TaxID=2880 RepID=D7FRY8_ECTSI|nr:expressed unknown protein [Ectocarpus siliculosus]|eukprot:CBJ30929.1 expressed unknown protein [Ectocarpus siliculosus]
MYPGQAGAPRPSSNTLIDERLSDQASALQLPPFRQLDEASGKASGYLPPFRQLDEASGKASGYVRLWSRKVTAKNEPPGISWALRKSVSHLS